MPIAPNRYLQTTDHWPSPTKPSCSAARQRGTRGTGPAKPNKAGALVAYNETPVLHSIPNV